ncbi:MAG: YciI family protein [Acidimicrobiia bacterium]
MPKYAALIYSSAEDETRETPPEVMQQVMGEYMEFGQNNEQSLGGGEALYPTGTATTLHFQGGRDGELVVTDGPFAETKEVLGGFYIIDASDLDGAIKVAQQIPGAWYGKIEVRPVMEFSETGELIS